MMLLSRIAEDLYWLGRNMERAESVSRLVREHTNLLVDLPVDVDSNWAALLTVTGSQDAFVQRYHRFGEAEVITFLMADGDNPGSMLHSINAARENLRVVRPLVPRSARECLNRLGLDAPREAGRCARRRERTAVTERVMASCEQFNGIMSGTMRRDHAYRFWLLGRLVEIADMTTRVLDVGAGTLMASSGPDGRPPADRSPYEDVRWLGVLGALAGHNMYHRSSGQSVSAAGVVRFLLTDPDFPRSVRHCATQIEALLGDLPARSRAIEAVAPLTRCTELRMSPSDPFVLHRHVDELQRSLAAVHVAITDSYFRTSGEPVAAAS
jgi:uncharacterized alpha-E superfamily protein